MADPPQSLGRVAIDKSQQAPPPPAHRMLSRDCYAPGIVETTPQQGCLSGEPEEDTAAVLAWFAVAPRRQSCPVPGWPARRRHATAPGPGRQRRAGRARLRAQPLAGSCSKAGAQLARGLQQGRPPKKRLRMKLGQPRARSVACDLHTQANCCACISAASRVQPHLAIDLYTDARHFRVLKCRGQADDTVGVADVQGQQHACRVRGGVVVGCGRGVG